MSRIHFDTIYQMIRSTPLAHTVLWFIQSELQARLPRLIGGLVGDIIAVGKARGSPFLTANILDGNNEVANCKLDKITALWTDQ